MSQQHTPSPSPSHSPTPGNEAPFSFELPVKFGYLDTVFCLNANFQPSLANRSSNPHNHHDYELYYVNSGHCTLTVQGKNHTASSGDLILIHPLEYHCKTHVSPANAVYFNFRFFVKQPHEKEGQPLPKNAYDYLNSLLLQTRIIHCRDQLISFYLNRLHTEIQERKRGYLGNIQSFFLLILTELVRLAGDLPEWFFPAEELKFRGYDRMVIDSFFANKYLSNVKIQDLAYDMKVSVRQVNRVMHRMFGMSFTQKLTEMRLWEVARQLESTQKAVTTISQNCGFNNYNYFYICFRKKFNMTPTEYRARNTKK